MTAAPLELALPADPAAAPPADPADPAAAPVADTAPDAPAGSAVPVLDFPGGLPGFPGAHRFVLVADDPGSGVLELRGLDEGAPSLVVVDPALWFPHYAPELDDATVERLGVTSPEEVLLLVVVTLGDSLASTTANLLAPLVVHRASRRGVQAVLSGSPWAVREPLVAAP